MRSRRQQRSKPGPDNSESLHCPGRYQSRWNHTTSTGRGVEGLHAYVDPRDENAPNQNSSRHSGPVQFIFECITDRNPQGSGSETDTDGKRMPLGRECEGRKTLLAHLVFGMAVIKLASSSNK